MSSSEAASRTMGAARGRRRPALGAAASGIGLYLVLLSFLILAAYPLVWLFYSSFKPQQEMFADAFALPKRLNVVNYLHIWGSSSFPRYYLNSILVTSISVAATVALSAMAGYVFARIEFRLRNVLFLLLLAGMMIPSQVMLVPDFILLRRTSLLDTYWAMILPYIAFQIPISVFIMRGFFAELPGELEDAATMDGYGKKGIFFKVLLPLSRPAIGTIIIYNFFAVWNELIFALTFTNSQQYRTIPVGLMDFVGQFETDYGYIFAALASASVPLLIVYFFAQKQIIKGLTAGAVKG